MLKSKNAILKGIEKFYLKEIATLDDTLMISAPFVIMKLRKFVEKNAEELKDLQDEDGLIDVSAVIEKYKEMATNAPNGYLEVKGIRLMPKDFDRLQKMIETEEN